MKRLAVTAFLSAALLVPVAAVAQSPSPEMGASPMPAASEPPLIGVDTMDVCLAITGPVIELTPEALTQGISDGTFVIEGLSTECETAGTEADASPMAEEPMTSPAAEEPMASPSPAA